MIGQYRERNAVRMSAAASFGWSVASQPKKRLRGRLLSITIPPNYPCKTAFAKLIVPKKINRGILRIKRGITEVKYTTMDKMKNDIILRVSLTTTLKNLD